MFDVNINVAGVGGILIAVAVLAGIVVSQQKSGPVTINLPSPNNQTQPTQPIPTTQSPPIVVQAPMAPGWTNHGKNALCDGRPKNTPFTCTSLKTGLPTTCMCD
jgi:hypothetical protein